MKCDRSNWPVRILKKGEDDSDTGYWLSKTPEERLQAIKILRQQYFELFHDGIEPRLQKVFTIVKRQRCKETK